MNNVTLTLDSAINRARNATKVAMNRTSKITSRGKSDGDLRLYSKLTEVELNAIARVYGENGLLNYIKQMEAKKLNAS